MEIVRNAINCKVEISLNWSKNCILSSEDGNSVFAMTDTKLYVPIVTLSAESNVKLSTLLGEGFKRSIYWNKYKVIDNKIVEIATNNEEKYIRELLDSSWQGVKIIKKMIIKFLLILIKNIFFQELK